jgi:hypothetical protein
MIRYGVQGDGTCFYYSLCAILNIDNFITQPAFKQTKIGRSYRCNFTNDFTWDDWLEFLRVKNITARKIKTMEQLVTRLCSYKVWADEPVIRFIMYRLKINLIFLDEHLNKLYCGVTEPESDMTAVILWVNKSHFEPLARLNALDVDGDQVALQFQFYPDADHEFIHRLMTYYNGQCTV